MGRIYNWDEVQLVWSVGPAPTEQVWSVGAAPSEQLWSVGVAPSEQLWSVGPAPSEQVWSVGATPSEQVWSVGPAPSEQLWSVGPAPVTLFEDYLDYWTDVFQTITSVDVLIKENYFRIFKVNVLSTLIGHNTADNLKTEV